MAPRPDKSTAKTKILNAALTIIRAKGYAATTMDHLCAASNVTKGAFFSPLQEQEAIRAACEASVGWHAEKIDTDIVEALRQGGVGSDLDCKKA